MNLPSKHPTRLIPLAKAQKFMLSFHLFLMQTKTSNKGPPLRTHRSWEMFVNYGVLFTFLPYLSHLSASI